MSAHSAKVSSRGDQFTPRLETKITQERANTENPYLIEEMSIHGYDHFELMEKCSVSDTIFLLLKGNLPNHLERNLFRELFIAFINPGPRHPATQASITAGVGKSLTTHILPISLSVFGGEFEGAANLEEAMRFYRRAVKKSPEALLEKQTEETLSIPGFGTVYGDPDPYATSLLEFFNTRYPQKVTSWVTELNTLCKQYNQGIKKAGVCAAVMADLGFQPRQANALYQLFSAPGLLAHGLEFANKPLTKMLFEPDSHYDLEDNELEKSPLQQTGSHHSNSLQGGN